MYAKIYLVQELHGPEKPESYFLSQFVPDDYEPMIVTASFNIPVDQLRNYPIDIPLFEVTNIRFKSHREAYQKMVDLGFAKPLDPPKWKNAKEWIKSFDEEPEDLPEEILPDLPDEETLKIADDWEVPHPVE